MNDLFDQLSACSTVLYTSNELPHYWLEKPLQTATESTKRIHAGHMINLQKDVIVDCDDNNPATHEIVSIRGSAKLTEITLRSLENEETKTITI